MQKNPFRALDISAHSRNDVNIFPKIEIVNLQEEFNRPFNGMPNYITQLSKQKNLYYFQEYFSPLCLWKLMLNFNLAIMNNYQGQDNFGHLQIVKHMKRSKKTKSKPGKRKLSEFSFGATNDIPKKSNSQNRKIHKSRLSKSRKGIKKSKTKQKSFHKRFSKQKDKSITLSRFLFVDQ